jgi:large subunit ribosomal protein L3
MIKPVKLNSLAYITHIYIFFLKLKQLNFSLSFTLLNSFYLKTQCFKLNILINNVEDFQLGQIIDVQTFKEGEFVDVTGKSIGKGFAGNQKRHHFTRGPMTHGSKNHRRPGSIGQGSTPGRVFPGKKMAGQLGNKITQIKKLKIIQVNSDENILVVKGSVQGKPGNLLSIAASE